MEASAGNPLTNMMDAVQAAMLSAAFGSIVAKFQASHIKELEAQGIDRQSAIQLTLGCSEQLVRGLRDIIEVLGTAAPNIAEAVKAFMAFMAEQEAAGRIR